MGHFRVHETAEIRAPIALVFERITDHEAMRDWPGVQSCRLVKPGQPRNGLGAVREVKVAGLRIQEEVVQFEPPTRFDYTIIKGLPVEHRGTITLEERQGVVHLAWEIRLASRWPLVARIAGRALGLGLPRTLAWFRRETEKAAR